MEHICSCLNILTDAESYIPDIFDLFGLLSCRHYLQTNTCPRFMPGEKIDQRTELLKNLVEEFHADGIVLENMKFCEFWSYEKVLQAHVQTNELGIPTCQIEKDYALTGAGQLRTRFQAFVEGLEIKQIESAAAERRA